MTTEYDAYQIEEAQGALLDRAKIIHMAMMQKINAASEDDDSIGELEDRAKDLGMWIKDMEFGSIQNWDLVENAVDAFEEDLK